MPNITTQYNSWDYLKPGDAIHKVGHVRLFIKRNSNGSFKVAELPGEIGMFLIGHSLLQIL